MGPSGPPKIITADISHSGVSDELLTPMHSIEGFICSSAGECLPKALEIPNQTHGTSSFAEASGLSAAFRTMQSSNFSGNGSKGLHTGRLRHFRRSVPPDGNGNFNSWRAFEFSLYPLIRVDAGMKMEQHQAPPRALVRYGMRCSDDRTLRSPSMSLPSRSNMAPLAFGAEFAPINWKFGCDRCLHVPRARTGRSRRKAASSILLTL